VHDRGGAALQALLGSATGISRIGHSRNSASRGSGLARKMGAIFGIAFPVQWARLAGGYGGAACWTHSKTDGKVRAEAV